jgi:hypothetical protein
MSGVAPTQTLTQGTHCLVTRAMIFFFFLQKQFFSIVANYHAIILFSRLCNYTHHCSIVCMQIYGEFNGFLSRDTAGDARECVETI